MSGKYCLCNSLDSYGLVRGDKIHMSSRMPDDRAFSAVQQEENSLMLQRIQIKNK